MIKQGVLYGVGIGVFLILANALIVLIGMNALVLASKFDIAYLIIPLFIVLCLFDFKKNKNAGKLHFWQGLLLGGIVMVIGLLIYFIYQWVYLGYNPYVLKEFIEVVVEKLTNQAAVLQEQVGVEAYESRLLQIKNTTALEYAGSQFFKLSLIGSIIVLISSVFLRRS